jgi:DNA-binding protein Fis
MQSINVIESPRLRKIFLLLRQELKESDIPGRTMIRNRIEKAYEDYLKQLEEEMAVCILFSLVIEILIIL